MANEVKPVTPGKAGPRSFVRDGLHWLTATEVMWLFVAIEVVRWAISEQVGEAVVRTICY